MPESETITFTVKEKRFIEEYMIDFNATQASIRAGYSRSSARQMGSELLTKARIKTVIDEQIKKLQLGAEETKKLIADISKGNANKYLIIVKREYTPRVEKHLSELIFELKEEMSFEEEFAIIADFSIDQFEEHTKTQDRRRRQVLRYELELKRNPNATKIVNGKTIWIESTEFDLVALAKDKEAGRIKSFKMTKDGPQVELYAADGALVNLARIHGLFKDNLEVNLKGSVSPDKWLQDNSESENVG